MGAIADGLVAYAKPLLDQTDGSQEQLNKAFTVTQLCFNLALMPDDQRETAINDMRPSLNMNDEEFEDFRRGVLLPMIERHREMFPLMHRRRDAGSSQFAPAPVAGTLPAPPAEPRRKIDRYAPCPCASGKKYKFCCGAKGR
jgi:hypothetical protein